MNSGGTAISGQELRNAIMAGSKPDVLNWFETLSKDENFIKVCGLAERDLSTRLDIELILRFIVFLSPELSNLPKARSVDVFLTTALRKILEDDDFDFDEYEESFKSTFKTIHNAWGENALRYKSNPGSGKFSISFFEAVALGIAQNLGNLPIRSEIKKKINSVGALKEFKSASGSGKNAQRRIPALVKLGKKHFSK